MNDAQSATLSADQRKKVLDRVLAALQKRFYEPEKLNSNWQAAVQRHRPLIDSANTPADFEKEVSDLLKELQTSHLGFFHRSARRASSRAALSATYLEDETEYGKRWIFQDVHAGGAASAAGIEPGDILLSVNDQNIVPPEHPVFTMGAYYTWKGSVLEGTPIEPDQLVAFDWRERRGGADAQLDRAIEVLRNGSLAQAS